MNDIPTNKKNEGYWNKSSIVNKIDLFKTSKIYFQIYVYTQVYIIRDLDNEVSKDKIEVATSNTEI